MPADHRWRVREEAVRGQAAVERGQGAVVLGPVVAGLVRAEAQCRGQVGVCRDRAVLMAPVAECRAQVAAVFPAASVVVVRDRICPAIVHH